MLFCLCKQKRKIFAHKHIAFLFTIALSIETKFEIMSTNSLGKRIWTEISKLKLLNANSDPKFILEKTPFDELDDDEAAQAASNTEKERVIIGRILPNSEIYNKGAYQIEIKLPRTFPIDPPEVRFVTQIYHPNVSRDG